MWVLYLKIMQAHIKSIKVTQMLFNLCLRTKDTQSLGNSSEIPAFQSAHPGQSSIFCPQQLCRQSCSWKSYVTWMISLLPLLWHFLVATQGQTVYVFKANIEKASFQDFVKLLEAEREWSEKQIGNKKGMPLNSNPHWTFWFQCLCCFF